jgi:succinate-semialdehyde dehydrogenase/glutarate-semialdehyde dehydrogenase
MSEPSVIERAPRVGRDLLRALESRVATSSDRSAIEVQAPFTGEVIGAVPDSGPDDVGEAVARARGAQKRWAELGLRARSRVMTRLHDLLIDRADTAMDVLQLESGKARIPAFEEVFDTVATTRYYVNTAPGLLRRRRRAVSLPGFTSAWEYRHPIGVVGSITPWNFPFTLSISDVIGALIAGNSVVVKPDEKTPYSALFGGLLLEEAGLPPDVFQVVTGRGETAGSALIDQVDFIAFTGSTQVGRVVSEHAGRRLVAASMELGGKNAAIVMADADLDRTVEGLGRAVYANGGQLCIAMEKIHVDERLAEPFIDAFVEYSRSLPITAAFDFSSSMSSIIDSAHVEKVHSHVEDAVAKGATLLTGGKPRPDVGPLFYEPTVLTDVDDSMILCRSETFGPVVSIETFSNVDDAIAQANDSEYGLNFSVWTADEDRGVDVASRLHAGTVGVNDGYAATWSSYDAPMGGMKASGISRRHGRIGLLKFTESQTIAVQRGIPAFAPPLGLDYHTYQRFLSKALKVLRRLPFYK